MEGNPGKLGKMSRFKGGGQKSELWGMLSENHV